MLLVVVDVDVDLIVVVVRHETVRLCDSRVLMPVVEDDDQLGWSVHLLVMELPCLACITIRSMECVPTKFDSKSNGVAPSFVLLRITASRL